VGLEEHRHLSRVRQLLRSEGIHPIGVGHRRRAVGSRDDGRPNDRCARRLSVTVQVRTTVTCALDGTAPASAARQIAKATIRR